MRLTKNFTRQEFDSKDSSPMPSDILPNIQKLANQLQALRDHLKRPITITSAYRSPAHNARVKGARNSRHLLGQAADIKVSGLTPRQVAAEIEKLIAQGDMLQGGIGIYPTFVHYDFRGQRVRF